MTTHHPWRPAHLHLIVSVPLRSDAPTAGRSPALNCSAAAARVSVSELQERFLPKLLHTAEQISISLGRRPSAAS